MKKDKSLYLQLFITMFKIGACTFGGGYAMISLLEREYVEKKQWLTKEEFLDMVAIAESTPGPIAINSATYIGYKKGGMAGSLFATLGMVLPSLTVIYLISLFFDGLLQLRIIAYAFKGIQVCVIYLILSAGLKLLRSLKKSVFNGCILLCVMAVMLACSLFSVTFSSVYYILLCGALGVVLQLIRSLKKKKVPKL